MQKNLYKLIIIITFFISATDTHAQKKKGSDPSEKIKTTAIADLQSLYDLYKTPNWH